MAHNQQATGQTLAFAKVSVPATSVMRSAAKSTFASSIAALCLLLAGCVGIQQHQAQQQQQQQQKHAFDTKGERFHAYLVSGKTAVDAGKLKQSVYYAKLYDLLNQPPVSPVDHIYMQGTARMIQASKQYEAGNITKQQLDATRRDVNVIAQEQTAQLQAREQTQRK